jgi:mannosyltransferase OCH1-like enzyme
VYEEYDQAIKRVGAVRYFIMHCHGGVYVDLDFEALRPLDSLLAEEELVLGCPVPEWC